MLMIFDQRTGPVKLWVPGGEESAWIARFGRWGTPAATLRQYAQWGGFYAPPIDSADRIMLRRPRRGHRIYAR